MPKKQDNTRLLECVRLSSTGEGVCYDEGLATFVPGLLPGESGQVQVIERKRNWQRAQLVTLVKVAPERQEAPCRVFGICGGCQLQHMPYDQTLIWKTRWVEDALARIGKIKMQVDPALGMEFPWRYRNKVRLHRKNEMKEQSQSLRQNQNQKQNLSLNHSQSQSQIKIKSKNLFGYYQEKSKDTVIFPDCLLISEDMNRWIDRIGELIEQEDPGVHTLTLRQNSRGEGLVLMEKSDLSGPLAERFRESAGDWLAQGVKEVWGLNSKGVPEQWLADDGFTEEILGLRFKVSPLAFLQVNHRQTEILYSLVLKWADLSGTETVWDLYCGIGTISLALASKAKKVIGIEENPFAIIDARKNAEINGMNHVEFLQGKAEEKIEQLSQSFLNRGPDLVVVDPPRAGLHGQVTAKLIELKPGRIIYVSCDPGTLARDLGRFVEGGYTVERVQPVDMFPWTQHVESIVLMTNSGLKGK